MICFAHPCYHPKTIRHIPKNMKKPNVPVLMNKNKDKNIKLAPSLTRRRSQLLNKLQIALNDSKENGILDAVKFVFADVHGSLKLVLQNPYKNRSVFSFNSELEFYQFVDKVTTKRSFPYEDEFEE